jgi:hypothetical protein
MFEYSFLQSFWCSVCGSQLELVDSASDGKEYKIKLAPCKQCSAQQGVRPTWICGFSQKGIGWFRVFGIGISWKDTRIHPLMFSERYGYCKGLRIGWWMLHFLKRGGM